MPHPRATVAYAVLALTTAVNTLPGAAALAGTHRAICSYYTRYEPCTVTISANSLEANLPTDFLSVGKQNYIDSKIYDDTGRESNHAIGAASTILFGPIGLLGFLATKRGGTVDFGIEFRDERGKKRTAFIRFVNMRAADRFGDDLKTFLQTMNRETGTLEADRTQSQ